jgi:pSer/pThr/pTyr-binding forkhead associated (FHA) protein
MEEFGKLRLVSAEGLEREYGLTKGVVSVGRATINDVAILDPKASRRHARVLCGPSGCQIEDLGSTNGTRVNGQSIQRATLELGDIIQIGDSSLWFEAYSRRPELEGTIIDAPPIESEAEMEATLAASGLEVVLSDTSLPRLAIHAAQKTWEVQLLGEMSIGRSGSNDIVLDQPRVSRHHALVRQKGTDWIIQDLDSTNGTWYRGQRIEEKRLVSGDMFRIGEAQLVFKAPFGDDELTLVDTPSERTAQRRPVVFLPGLMGSELWRGEELLWPRMTRFLREPEVLRYPSSEGMEPRGVVHEVVVVPNLIKLDQYSRMVDFLVEELGYTSGLDLLEFPYDWRQDLRLSARELREAIGRWREEQGHGRVTVMAHSLGCMVSRYYVERLGGRNEVERLVLMGGPLYGVPKIVLPLLLGRGLLPFGLLGDRIRQVVATFPSIYQILPTYPCVFEVDGEPIDLYTDPGWVADGYEGLWQDGRQFWSELGTSSSVSTLSIFGYGIRTVTKLRAQRDRSGRWRDVQFEQEELGDGSVPEVSTLLPGAEIHPVHQNHGALFTDNDVRMRLRLELIGWRA